MNEEMNPKISQFLDNELDYDEALDLLQKLRANPELTNKLNRYEAISHALKTDQFLNLSTDFSEKVSQQLQHEPVYLLPRKKPANRRFPYQWLALAASVAVVSVLAVRSLPHLGGNDKVPATSLQVAQQQTPKTLPNSPVDTPKTESEIPLNARINDYLQAHNGSVYANNPNLKSMARVTTYNQK
ncbi:MAG: sigma-E factor negative regulatory protein [Methylovulum sp.]|uniref:sigma-E factor negative regulatory protein n=1 Tax=Methylovulum sp. TaxID=1916980 RepID=UPI002617C203|nr:sigma-E factor negative regulatory protein [Methylovulum sp.]MDD2722436.1 sigma-E factor negative regulatory protein [Methylovulum sp.]MDD5124429.1 sigma-E factor negative regulatory protein [Methylovulum sp.]